MDEVLVGNQHQPIARQLGVELWNGWFDGAGSPWERGVLVTGDCSISAPTRTQNWTLDQVGNWLSNTIDSTTQTRTFNAANEATGIAVTGGGSMTPAYDNTGNMMTAPDPNNMTGAGYAGTYDAWNRLVKVEDGSSNVLEEMRYDGLNQRIAKLIPGSGGNWDRTDYYYNGNWQVLQEGFATGNKDTVAPYAKYQYVWDVRYIDAPVLRDENTDTDTDVLCDDVRLFYMQDANFNVMALIGTDGTVAERYVYDAYGKRTTYDNTWANTKDWADSAKNEVLYCGYRYDPKIGLYHVRNRYYHPVMGAWVQRDPIGYVDGVSLYNYVSLNPTRLRDPLGLAATFTKTGPETYAKNVFPATPAGWTEFSKDPPSPWEVNRYWEVTNAAPRWHSVPSTELTISVTGQVKLETGVKNEVAYSGTPYSGSIYLNVDFSVTFTASVNQKDTLEAEEQEYKTKSWSTYTKAIYGPQVPSGAGDFTGACPAGYALKEVVIGYAGFCRMKRSVCTSNTLTAKYTGQEIWQVVPWSKYREKMKDGTTGAEVGKLATLILESMKRLENSAAAALEAQAMRERTK